MLFKSAIVLILAASFSLLGQEALYNDARVIYHAIDPDFPTELEGINPEYSIQVLQQMLTEYATQKYVSEEARKRIERVRESLEAAKRRYFICIDLVKRRDESIFRQVATELSNEVQGLFYDPLLFVDGHYAYSKGGLLGGHTATYEVERQENGRLSFAVTNTLRDAHHEVDGNAIKQLVYVDLEPGDLDDSFWESVILINYLNLKEEKRMSSFYAYLDAKLLKEPSNKRVGRAYTMQKAGVCGWKSISVWLDGKIDDERRFNRFMFETFLANFHPGESSHFLQKALFAKLEELKE